MTKLYFVTGNQHKFQEVAQIIDKNIELEQIKIDLEELQTTDLEQVVIHKAFAAYKQISNPVLIEDTALYFQAWKALPGPLVRWFLEAVGSAGMCKMMSGEQNRQVSAVTKFALYDGQDLKTCQGETTGTIADAPRGENGFGWDNIFIPDGQQFTFAEMDEETKNIYSMRRKALEALEQLIGTPEEEYIPTKL